MAIVYVLSKDGKLLDPTLRCGHVRILLKQKRILPGNLFYCDGKRYVLSGQLSHGQYLRAFGDKETNFPARECKLVSSGGWMYL